jgi:hypothetical protein
LDWLVVLAATGGVVLLLCLARGVVMWRGLSAYGQGRELERRGNLSPSDSDRLERLRGRARSWGPDMDPGLSGRERLSRMDPKHAWLTQNIDGSEDPADLDDFADVFVLFAQGSGAGYTDKAYDQAKLTFAQLVASREFRRLDAIGIPRGPRANELARAKSRDVCVHFLASTVLDDGTWAPIGPKTVGVSPRA